MKDVKTREHNNAPRVMPNAARAPKELAKRSMIQAKERAREAAQRPETQQDESPEQYAENQVVAKLPYQKNLNNYQRILCILI